MQVGKGVAVPLQNTDETMLKRKRLIKLTKARRKADDEIKKLQYELLFYRCPFHDMGIEESFTI